MSTLPSPTTPPTSREETTTQLAQLGLPPADELARIQQMAGLVAEGGMYPAYRGRPEAAATVMLKARELGLGAIQGLDAIHLVDGKVTLSAELMRALTLRAGHQLDILEFTPTVCRVAGYRRDQDTATELAFTIEDAKRAGVAGRKNWQAYPQAMLLARATSMLCRAIFPDVLVGASYTPDELGHHDQQATTTPPSEALPAHLTDPARPDQGIELVGLQHRLGLTTDQLNTGIAAATGHRATHPAELSAADAEHVIARMRAKLRTLEPDATGDDATGDDRGHAAD